MDNAIIKKRLSTFKSSKGSLTRVSDDVLADVIRAWEQWTGKSTDLARELGVDKYQLVFLIKKALLDLICIKLSTSFTWQGSHAYLIRAKVFLKSGCLQVLSHSNASISTVLSVAPDSFRRRVAMDLSRDWREPMASTTIETAKPCSSSPRAVCIRQTCASQPTNTNCLRSLGIWLMSPSLQPSK